MWMTNVIQFWYNGATVCPTCIHARMASCLQAGPLRNDSADKQGLTVLLPHVSQELKQIWVFLKSAEPWQQSNPANLLDTSLTDIGSALCWSFQNSPADLLDHLLILDLCCAARLPTVQVCCAFSLKLTLCSAMPSASLHPRFFLRAVTNHRNSTPR